MNLSTHIDVFDKPSDARGRYRNRLVGAAAAVAAAAAAEAKRRNVAKFDDFTGILLLWMLGRPNIERSTTETGSLYLREIRRFARDCGVLQGVLACRRNASCRKLRPVRGETIKRDADAERDRTTAKT